MNKRDFLQAYVLAAARGAGHLKLNVEGAIKEAREAYAMIEKETRND